MTNAQPRWTKQALLTLFATQPELAATQVLALQEELATMLRRIHGRERQADPTNPKPKRAPDGPLRGS